MLLVLSLTLSMIGDDEDIFKSDLERNYLATMKQMRSQDKQTSQFYLPPLDPQGYGQKHRVFENSKSLYEVPHKYSEKYKSLHRLNQKFQFEQDQYLQSLSQDRKRSELFFPNL